MNTPATIPAAAAIEAAFAVQATFDRSDYPSAAEAYAFIRGVWREESDRRYYALPERMPATFEQVYIARIAK